MKNLRDMTQADFDKAHGYNEDNKTHPVDVLPPQLNLGVPSTPSSDLDIIRRAAEHGLKMAHEKNPEFVDIFQHLLDEVQRCGPSGTGLIPHSKTDYDEQIFDIWLSLPEEPSNRTRAILFARMLADHHSTFQQRVNEWMQKCFGPEISADPVQRNHRFLEEAIELVQACDCTRSEAHQLVDYVFDRPVGEKYQEIGGVMVTGFALALAHGLDMQLCGETELTRINDPKILEKIRAKQAAKPKHSPLPE